MKKTICAKVNPRLLSKADRLFTGTVEGRIIELLQNARRAGATEVKISNKNNTVTVSDNGSGIGDFQKLLDLGDSGWDEKLEAGEDPAGVGLFSLAPRKVTIISGDKQVVIDSDGWTGEPVYIEAAKELVNGTIIRFEDDCPWNKETVEKYAVFCGMKVTVDDHICPTVEFCSDKAVFFDEIGCKIEVVSKISEHHRNLQWKSYRNVLVNFHGQVVDLGCYPSQDNHNLTILVDLERKTDIRLMLPARTRLVENIAYKRLVELIEVQFYEYFKRQKSHTLPYSDWLRAKEIGVELPEAMPCYDVGLLRDEYDMVTDVVEPQGFELRDAYLEPDGADEILVANIHLLGALGIFKGKRFVPVSIRRQYMGYSWTNLPKVSDVKVESGKELLRYDICGNELVCFESLKITVNTSDGNTFASDVPMAIVEQDDNKTTRWFDKVVCVTRDAQELSVEEIWYHLGGFNYEGDTFDTQQYYMEKDLDEFWNKLIGPYETFRQKLLSQTNSQNQLYDKWEGIYFSNDGMLKIVFKGGKVETVNPPK